jgi:hypothetical protein
MTSTASSSSAAIASYESASKRANIGSPAANSMPPLGSSTHGATRPARMAEPSARSSDHRTEPLPAFDAPTIRMCVPSSRRSHTVPSAWTPTGSAAKSTAPASLIGIGATEATSESERAHSSKIRRGLTTRTRSESAPKVCARADDTRCHCSGACPETMSTVTRSTCRPHLTRTTAGTYSVS